MKIAQSIPHWQPIRIVLERLQDQYLKTNPHHKQTLESISKPSSQTKATMKALIFAISLLTIGPGVSALPEPELGSITEGDFTFTGGDLPRGDEKVTPFLCLHPIFLLFSLFSS